MPTINWLNDNGILVSKKLADAIAEFEYLNKVNLDNKSVTNFIQEVVKLTKQVLSDSDNLRHNVCQVDIIHDIILQLDLHSPLRMAIYMILFDMTGEVRDFQIGDATDRLIMEIIRCTVQGYDRWQKDV